MATKKVLLTSSSFIDTPGPHRDLLLNNPEFEVVVARGPLGEKDLIEIINTHHSFDGIVCGEDSYNREVLLSLSPTTKVISKYGVGLDKIDLETAAELNIKVTNTPGVNHITVTELAFGLILSLARNIPEENTQVHQGHWARYTGNDLFGKTLGIIGYGRVGREMVKRATAFGMNVLIFNSSWSETFESELSRLKEVLLRDPYNLRFLKISRVSEREVLENADYISLHMNLNNKNRGYLNEQKILTCKRGVRIINVSRGALVDQDAIAKFIKNSHLGGYAADVVDPEPIKSDNPLLGLKNVVLTPHIGSRTFESVVRQGTMAVNNMLENLS